MLRDRNGSFCMPATGPQVSCATAAASDYRHLRRHGAHGVCLRLIGASCGSKAHPVAMTFAGDRWGRSALLANPAEGYGGL